jgi:hypothetical protein
VTGDPDDRAAYVRALIAHRCPELTDADLAFTTITPDDLPLEVADKIGEVLDLLERKLESLESLIAGHSLPPPETVAEAFRQAMVDLDLDAKRHILSELDRWVSRCSDDAFMRTL